ncbi:MAG: glycosyltransferase family 39 protein [Actinomycetota bacterium]
MSSEGQLAESDGRASAPPVDDGSDPAHRRFVWVIIAIVVAILWIRPLVEGLWLDEFGTWWVIKDGWSETIARATRFQGQSPLYYLVAHLARVMGGGSEPILRVPSLAAFAGSAFLVWRLGRRLFDDETARLAVLVFSGGIASFAAADARPYAVAVLFTTASAAALVAWLDSGRPAMAIVYVVCSALAVWAHFVFALGLLAIVPYALVRARRRSTSVRTPMLALTWAAVLVLSLPLLGQVTSLLGRSASLTIPAELKPIDVIFALFNPAVAMAVLVGLGLTATYVWPEIGHRHAARSAAYLIVPWALGPPGLLLVLSLVSTVRFVPPRYSYSAAPAAALLGGWVLSSIEPALARRLAAACFAIIAVLTFGSRARGGEDWRAAVGVVRDASDASTVILAHPGFIESAQVDWLLDPERSSYLLAPFSYYQVPGQLILMPLHLERADERAFVDDIVDERLAHLDRFLFITRDPSIPFKDRIDGSLRRRGWSWRSLGTFGIIEVFEFTRSG